MKTIVKTVFYSLLAMPFISLADVVSPPQYIADEYIPRPDIPQVPDIDSGYHVFVCPAIIEILLLIFLIIVCNHGGSHRFDSNMNTYNKDLFIECSNCRVAAYSPICTICNEYI